MDYIWIGIRAFTYVIIFTLIKIIVPKLLGNVKYKKDEMGRTYFSKKKISYFLFVIAVFFTVLLSFLSTIPSNVSGEAKIYLNVGIVIFCLLWYILSIMFDVWYIHLEPTQIIYRNYLGAKKVIKASDIYYFERNSNGSLIIVCSDRKGRESDNLLILCPNHHSLIHVLNPKFDYDELQYIYPDGKTDKIILDLHLTHGKEEK